MTAPSNDERLAQRLFAAARSELPSADAEERIARAAVAALDGQGAQSAPGAAVASVDATPVPLRSAVAQDRLQVRRLRHAVAVLAIAAAFLVVGGGLFVKKQNDERAAAEAAAEEQRRDLQDQIDVAKAEVDTRAAAVNVAALALSSARDESARAVAQHDLDVAKQKQNAASAAIRRASAGGSAKASPASPASPASAASAACTCTKMDPLCGCVP